MGRKFVVVVGLLLVLYLVVAFIKKLPPFSIKKWSSQFSYSFGLKCLNAPVFYDQVAVSDTCTCLKNEMQKKFSEEEIIEAQEDPSSDLATNVVKHGESVLYWCSPRLETRINILSF